MMWSIAVCDDNRRQCRELAALLEIYGEENRIAVETEVFYDGCSLSKRMREGKRYDLIFLDVLMEGMDGIEVGNRIRRGIGDEEVQLVYICQKTGLSVTKIFFVPQGQDPLSGGIQRDPVFSELREKNTDPYNL